MEVYWCVHHIAKKLPDQHSCLLLRCPFSLWHTMHMYSGYVKDLEARNALTKCGSRIWSRGGQLLRLKVANVAEWHCASEVSYLQPGSRVLNWALEVFGALMLKYEFCHIRETLFLPFLISTSTPKAETSTFNLHWLRNGMLSEVRLNNFEFELWKIAK